MSVELIQRSPEWYAMRLGKVTGSRIADLTARTKTGWGASRANYMAELLIEHLTGEPAPSFVSPAMQWGMDQEPEARAAYEWRADCTIEQVGFVHHPRIVMSGCSPDGLVGNDGLVEIKCPNTATHITTLLHGSVPEAYTKQMQWQMACTGRAWCDWVSYDPRLPENMRLFVQRVPRHEVTITALEGEVVTFLEELNAKLAELRAKYETKAAA
jgi:putative phage-type endonuclease